MKFTENIHLVKRHKIFPFLGHVGQITVFWSAKISEISGFWPLSEILYIQSEWEIISEWNLVLKKSLRIQGFFPQLPANLIDSHSKHSHINQQEVEKLSPTEFTSDCLLGGLFTHLFVLWNLGYFSKVVATFNHVGGAVGP